MFAKGQEGFHHIAVVCDDYLQELDRYVSQGFELAFEGVLDQQIFVMLIPVQIYRAWWSY